MRVRLLNSGGFKELENISFPVDVEAVGTFFGAAHIHKKELKKCKGWQDLDCFTVDIFCFQPGFFELLLEGGKPFDITQHEWESGDVFTTCANDVQLHFSTDLHCQGVSWISRNDAIAIAKHFNLTAEDLK